MSEARNELAQVILEGAHLPSPILNHLKPFSRPAFPEAKLSATNHMIAICDFSARLGEMFLSFPVRNADGTFCIIFGHSADREFCSLAMRCKQQVGVICRLLSIALPPEKRQDSGLWDAEIALAPCRSVLGS